MHSALPHSVTPRKYKSKVGLVIWRILGTVGVCGIVWFLYQTRSNFHNYIYKSTVRSEPIVVLDEPIYFPDLGQLAQYRASHTVKLPDGVTDVDSRTVSYLYKGSGGRDFDKQRAGKIASDANYQGDPEVVLVVGLGSTDTKEMLEKVIENRKGYAERHGYGMYARYLEDFSNENSEDLNKAALVRDAMAVFPRAKWMWWLDQDAVIMDMSLDVSAQLLDPQALSPLMIRDAPVVPPQSEIHTYRRIPANKIEFICSQNDRGMSSTSFFVKNTQSYGHILMEFWNDPLQRAFVPFRNGPHGVLDQQSDASLTHLVQWHPALFSRMAVVPSKYTGSWMDDGEIIKDQRYSDGGFVVILHSTNEKLATSREAIMDRWRSVLGMKPNT